MNSVPNHNLQSLQAFICSTCMIRTYVLYYEHTKLLLSNADFYFMVYLWTLVAFGFSQGFLVIEDSLLPCSIEMSSNTEQPKF